MLTALTGLFAMSAAHAQGRVTLIGLGNPASQDAIAPGSYNWWVEYVTHQCEPFGLGSDGDLDSHFYPHFLWATDPLWSTDPLAARVRGEVWNGESMLFSQATRPRLLCGVPQIGPPVLVQ